MDLGLDGSKVLITGGSRGIGKSIAEHFLAEGAAVAFCARDAVTVEETRSSLEAHGHAIGSAVDVSDLAALDRWVDESAEALGGIDIVISNASGGGSGGNTDEAFDRHVAIDMKGLVHLVNSAKPHLEASEHGAITAIGTTAAIEHFGSGISAYGAVKAGVIALVAGFAQALAPLGIRANSVSPGPIFFEAGPWDQARQANPDAFSSIEQAHPFKRLGTAPEVARVVLFLSSPSASWVTGENVVIDGAFTRRIGF